jgi:guanylate kinase
MGPVATQGKLILIVGPSGSGKRMLTEHVRHVFPQLVFPVSCVTRMPRPGEEDGHAYYFISREEFGRRKANGDFLETDEHFLNLYGTLKSEVLGPLSDGKVLFREMEIKGAGQVQAALSREQLVLIYVDAGSWEELEERIRARAPISDEEMETRKVYYQEEVKFRDKADYVVSNLAGKAEEAKRQLEAMVAAILEDNNQLKRPMAIILMGPQGSGKGTQLALLRDHFESKQEPVLTVETGKAFRVFVEGKGHTYDMVRESLMRGERQPDFLASLLWENFFVEHIKGNEHLVMDGFPRTLLQAELDESKAVERLLKRGRADDTESAIRERLRWYREEVEPIIGYYQKKPGHVVLPINADQSIEVVQRDILQALKLS